MSMYNVVELLVCCMLLLTSVQILLLRCTLNFILDTKTYYKLWIVILKIPVCFFAEFTYWLYCYCLRKLRNHWQTDLYFDWFIVFFPAILTTWRTTSSATLRNQRRQWRIFHSKESSCEYWVTHVIVNFRLVMLETGKPFNWFPKPVNRFATGNWFWKRITSYQIFMMDLLTVHYAFAASLHVAATRSRQRWQRSLITISAQWRHVNATSLSTSAVHVLHSLILSAYVRMRLEKHGIADYRIMDKSYKTKETEDQKTRVRLNDCNPSFKLPRPVINSWRASCRLSHLLVDLLTPHSALAAPAFRVSGMFAKRVGATELPHSAHTGHPRPSRFDKCSCDQKVTSAFVSDASSNTGWRRMGGRLQRETKARLLISWMIVDCQLTIIV